MTNNDGWTTKPVFEKVFSEGDRDPIIQLKWEDEKPKFEHELKPKGPWLNEPVFVPVKVLPERNWQPDEQFMHSLEERLTVEVQKMNQHDPYLNPNAHLVYECADCPNELDPKTKSFAGLNNAAMIAGWKVRWGEVGYNAFCPGCAEQRNIGE